MHKINMTVTCWKIICFLFDIIPQQQDSRLLSVLSACLYSALKRRRHSRNKLLHLDKKVPLALSVPSINQLLFILEQNPADNVNYYHIILFCCIVICFRIAWMDLDMEFIVIEICLSLELELVFWNWNRM